MPRGLFPVLLVLAAFAPFACSSSVAPGSEDAAVSSPDASTTPRRDAAAPPPLPPLEQRGIPCEVATIFAKRCLECHDGELDLPRLGTQEDLSAPYAPAGGKPLAEVALAKMTAERGFMPPPPRERVPKPERDALAAWIAAGFPRQSCDPTPRDASAD